MNGEHPAFHEDAVEEPVRQRHGHARGLAGCFVGYLGPAFKPVERRGFFLSLSANVRAHGSMGKPVEGGADSQVMLTPGRPPDGFEEIVGMEMDNPAWGLATVERLGDLS